MDLIGNINYFLFKKIRHDDDDDDDAAAEGHCRCSLLGDIVL